jgi:hypothetical protein
MKPFPSFVLFTALAAAGYFAGARITGASFGNSGESTTPSATAASAMHPPDEIPSNADGLARDPRTGATFAESLGRLEELAKEAKSDRHIRGGSRSGKAHLEIERLFALATREEMLEYFTTTDPAQTGDLVLSLAYARLATLSIDEAVAVWSDQLRRTDKGTGVEGLVRIWAVQDAGAAERWVDALESKALRNTALRALLQGAMEQHPELVERRLTDLDFRSGSDELASRLAWRIEPQDLPALADRLCAERKGSWEAQFEVARLLMVWGERDGRAMIAWMMGRPTGSLKDHVIASVAESRAKADPAGFTREIGPFLADSPQLAEMAGSSWLRWLQSGDEDAAMDWFESHGEHVELGQSGGYSRQNWIPENALRVLDRLAQLPDEKRKGAFSRSILRSLSNQDPESALALVDGYLAPGTQTDQLVRNTLSNLAQSGKPEYAMDWAVQHIEPGQALTTAVNSVMNSWVETKPVEAFEKVKSLPEALRNDAYGALAYGWARKSPEQVLACLASSSDPAALTTFAKGAFSALGSEKGGEAYLDAALNLPDEGLRKVAVESLFNGWSSANAETSAAALGSLDRGPLRDIAIVSFTNQVSRVDPEAAFAWSLEIEAPEKRRTFTLQNGKQWLKTDRAAATRWIEASAKLPAEWRAELLKPAP